jgi:hypothetical protein
VLLAWAVSCDSYELHEDGTADIFGAGFDTFRVDGLPAGLELIILVRLLMMEDETSDLELHILGPETTSLFSDTFEIEAEPGPNHRLGYTVSQTEALEIEFVAEREGPYSAEIYVDGHRGDPMSEERRRTIFFNVREGLPET